MAKLKMKTKSSSKKRFKITATGKVRFWHANKKHILTKKKPRRRRHLRGGEILRKGDEQQIMRTLPHGGGV